MSKQAKKILLVDDEPDIIELLSYNLEKEGYTVQSARDGRAALEVAKDYNPDMVLIDIMMPIMDGVEACRQLKENPQTANCFIIFLTARTEEYSEIAAFDVGADDYITKPIKPRALLSRINAFFKRESKKNKHSSKIDASGLIIDKASYTVVREGESILLPKKEFELLYFLAQNPNKVFSRDDLLQNIWGSDVYVLARTVDVHVRKVREKLERILLPLLKA